MYIIRPVLTAATVNFNFVSHNNDLSILYCSFEDFRMFTSGDNVHATAYFAYWKLIMCLICKCNR